MKMNEEKKFQRSPMTIVCYVLAALLLILAIQQMVSAWSTAADYYAAYELDQNPMDECLYVLQSAMATLTFTFLAFIGEFSIGEIRKLNPESYKTKSEVLAAKETKKLAKAEKKSKKNASGNPAAKEQKQG